MDQLGQQSYPNENVRVPIIIIIIFKRGNTLNFRIRTRREKKKNLLKTNSFFSFNLFHYHVLLFTLYFITQRVPYIKMLFLEHAVYIHLRYWTYIYQMVHCLFLIIFQNSILTIVFYFILFFYASNSFTFSLVSSVD